MPQRRMRHAGQPCRSALGVLRRLPGLLQPVLLALLDPGVPGQEPRPLQGSPVLGVHQRERPSDTQPQRAGLAGDAAAGDPGGHVELALRAQGDQRLADELLMHLVREEVLQRPVVDAPLAGARGDADPRDRFLAPAGAERTAGHHRPAGRRADLRFGGRLGGVLRDVLAGLVLRLRVSTLVERLRGSGLGHYLPRASCCAIWLIANGTGCCAACGWSGPAYTFSFRSMFRPSEFLGSMPRTAFSTTRSGCLAISSEYVTECIPPGYPECR